MAGPIYKGYSSFEFQARDTFLLTDVELVKLDLLNHIFTRRGERVKMAQFGTRIPDLAFEPLDQETLDILYFGILSWRSLTPWILILQWVRTQHNGD